MVMFRRLNDFALSLGINERAQLLSQVTLMYLGEDRKVCESFYILLFLFCVVLILFLDYIAHHKQHNRLNESKFDVNQVLIAAKHEKHILQVKCQVQRNEKLYLFCICKCKQSKQDFVEGNQGFDIFNRKTQKDRTDLECIDQTFGKHISKRVLVNDQLFTTFAQFEIFSAQLLILSKQ